jgi:transposase
LALLSGGKHPARKLKRAQILLAADAGVGDEDIATSVGVGGSTVYRTKRRFVEGNLERALSEEARPGAERKLTGKEEALLVATACSSPPAGRVRWTLTLLADALVKLTAHESLSRETVRRRLAENDLKPWRKGAFRRSTQNMSPAWRMCARSLCRTARPEAAGGLLRREPDPADRRGAPADPSQAGADRALRLRVSPQRHREPVRLSRCAPLLAQGEGHRARAAEDFAACMRELADVHYPKAERIRVVLDNLSTHSAGALYQAFQAAEARRILRRLEFHYVPKHASCLNMVEIEIGVLASQCLDRRIESYPRLVAETAAWESNVTPSAPASNGCSQPKKPAPKWGEPIPGLMPNQPGSKSQNLCDEVLATYWIGT